MTTVFITGVTGFVGKALIPKVLNGLKPEDRVYLLVRKPVEFPDERVVAVVGDLTSLENVAGIVRQADFIIHIGAEARLNGGHDYSAVNVVATRQLVALAKESHALQRFIFISSIAAMDRAPSDLCNEPIKVTSPCFPRTEYGKSKQKAEESILKSNLPYTIFRPGYVYGSGMRNDSHLRKFAQLIKRGVPLHRIGFPGKISLIHVDDLAAAIVKCLTTDSGINRICLAETEYMPLGDALSFLGESLFGRKSLQARIPPVKAVFQRMHSQLPVIVAGLFLDYYWMDDSVFRCEFMDGDQQRFFRDNVFDITRDL